MPGPYFRYTTRPCAIGLHTWSYVWPLLETHHNQLNMKFLINLLISAIAVFAAAYFIPGVGVSGFGSAIMVAIVLGLFNSIVRPILAILTIPITIITLGLFLLVLNVLMVYATAAVVPGFSVSGFFPALFFSLLVSLVSGVLGMVFKD